MMTKYPIGIQDFEKLREGGYLYVDKTSQIHQLITQGNHYFLSRPRRFGKSLLLSTIKYVFLGKKNLFRDLYIEEKHDWKPHPVLHISFSSIGYQNLGLEDALSQEIDIAAAKTDIHLNSKGLAPRFKEFIQSLGAGDQKLVLLIDEYDKPLVDYIDAIPKAEKNREILKNFFSVIKDSDAYLRFFLITGVSKFSKVSLFSDLNHLEDLTLTPQGATLTGYTQQELETYFTEAFDVLKEKHALDDQEVRKKVKEWYNGYLWAGEERLYNPFSILSLFKQLRFANFWWETGTPTFLLQILKRNFRYELEELEVGPDIFESYTLENLEWRSLLFQTGYLTLKGYDPEVRLYQLGYPNFEVRDAMYRHLLATFREKGEHAESQMLLGHIKRALEANDLERLIELIDVLFSTIPHQIFIEKQEAFFHAVLHITFQGLGLLTYAEVNTSKGRVDTVVHTRKRIYVMEFKLDAPVTEALEQIRTKRYGSTWLEQGKEVYAIGISFSSEKRTVSEWKALPYKTLLIEG